METEDGHGHFTLLWVYWGEGGVCHHCARGNPLQSHNPF